MARGERHSINKIFKILAELPDFKKQPIYAPPRIGDIRNSLADISAARDAYGYQVAVSFEEGQRRTVEGYKQVAAR